MDRTADPTPVVAIGTFARGDVHVYDETQKHSQQVGPGEACICLVVNADRLVPLTWFGRLLAKMSDI